jgi:hypothetical protein
LGDKERIDGQPNGTVAHKQVVVFERKRPVPVERVFAPDTDHAAPAGLAAPESDEARRQRRQRCEQEGVLFVPRNGGTALHIEQERIPRVAELTSEQANCIDLGTVWKVGSREESERRRIGSSQVCPIALRFDAKYPRRLLPAVTDLTAAGGASRRVTALGPCHRECRNDPKVDVEGERIPALSAPRAAAIGADVKTGPPLSTTNTVK